MNFCCRGRHGPLYRVDGTTRITTISAADQALEIFILETSILVSMIADHRETFLLGVSCIIPSVWHFCLSVLHIMIVCYWIIIIDQYINIFKELKEGLMVKKLLIRSIYGPKFYV